ncbi:MAG TPA: hypothetical protein O0W81_02035 [Methanocorpusculum sp.]|nr:hypothetical protein [Methanocorpusculum sp.]
MNNRDRKPEDVMAEYLISGAKMLADLCPNCGAPLFEVKGKRMCVICAETSNQTRGEKHVTTDGSAPIPENVQILKPKYAKEQSNQVPVASDIPAQLDNLILKFCARTEREPDPTRCLAYMECIRTAAEARAILNR